MIITIIGAGSIGGSTPNGLTLRGLKAMEEGGFSEAVIRGLTVIIPPETLA